MVDEDLYILVICDKCEVILGILPKFYQKATWKAGRPREPTDEADAGEAAVGAPAPSSSSGKPEPGAATIRALEKKKKADDRRLRWS